MDTTQPMKKLTKFFNLVIILCASFYIQPAAAIKINQEPAANFNDSQLIYPRYENNRERQKNQQITPQNPENYRAATNRNKPAATNKINNLNRAIKELSRLKKNTQLSIPLGTNSPISIAALPQSNLQTMRVKMDMEAIAVTTRGGKAEAITVGDSIKILETAKKCGGSLTNCKSLNRSFIPSNAEGILVASARGSFLQVKKIPVFDLVVRNKKNNKIYFVPNVNADAFMRDIANAAINRTFGKNTVNLNKIKINNNNS